MTTTCPCCGGFVRADRPLVDLNSNSVSFRGQTVKLEPQETELLSLIAGSYPAPTHRDRIISRMWGTLEPDYAYNIVSVRIGRLRKKIKHLGLTLEPVHSFGPRLIIEKAAA